jgi:hypothetical protein
MHIQTFGLTAVVLLMTLGAGCKKEEKTTPAPQGETPTMGGIQINQGPGGTTPDATNVVTRYSDEGPEIGTVTLRRSATARKAADQTSEAISHPGQGTLVTKKARHGGYYLVEVPVSATETKLGWIGQDDVNMPAPAVTTVTTVTTATPGGRPPPVKIIIPKR